MNGPQHFIAAERCLAEAIRKHSALYMDAAIVHATLANAAAIAGAFAIGSDLGANTERQWHEIFKAAAKEAAPDTPIYNAMTTPAAAPLVTCLATCPDVPGVVRCTLPVDHDGPHASDLLNIGWPSAAIERCGARPYPAGSEGDDGTECTLPADHDGPHDDQADEDAPSFVRPYAANL